MQIEFDKKLKNKIKEICLKNKFEESCGLIFFNQNNFKFDIFPCKNRASNKRINFSISPQDYLTCNSLGKIVASYHSHVNGSLEFSEIDKQNSNIYKICYILYNLELDQFNIYYPNTEKNPYIGRPYITQVSDCFSLVKDFLKKEANIDMWFPDNMTYPKELKDIKGLYHDNFEQQGFLKLDKNTKLQKYDGIMVAYPNISEEYPSHCAIYLENDTILHQPYNSFSCVTKYDNLLKKYTKYILRHRSKV